MGVLTADLQVGTGVFVAAMTLCVLVGLRSIILKQVLECILVNVL